jgi:putative transposase
MPKKTFKFRIYPTKTRVKNLESWLDLCRELYNAALQERRDAWKLNKVFINYFDQSAQLPAIKAVREDLTSVNAQVLQNILRRLDKTFKAFFARIQRNEKAGFPRFKSQNGFDSFTFPQAKKGFKLIGNKLLIHRIGTLKIKLSREIQGTIKTLTIKRENGKWFATFVCDDVPVSPLPKTNKQVGIDVGIESFLTLSDGTQIENSKYYQNSQRQLRVAQRRLSRRKKGSNRRKVAVRQLAKIHAKIRNQRADFQHKLSTKLINEFDLIAIEKLNISGMRKGFLSKQVNDVAWFGFFQMLRYKAENADRKLIEINPAGTSQTCICGERVEKTLAIRVHSCGKCGLLEHRDIVSAKVILQRALGQSVKASTSAIGQSVALESANPAECQYTVMCKKSDNGYKLVECTCKGAERGLVCYHAAAALSLHIGLARQRA